MTFSRFMSFVTYKLIFHIGKCLTVPYWELCKSGNVFPKREMTNLTLMMPKVQTSAVKNAYKYLLKMPFPLNWSRLARFCLLTTSGCAFCLLYWCYKHIRCAVLLNAWTTFHRCLMKVGEGGGSEGRWSFWHITCMC